MSGEPVVLAGEYLRGVPQTPALPKSGVPRTPAFAMVEERIFDDPKLHRIDVSVYGLLACARRGALSSMGERRLAKRLRALRRSIRASIRRLEASGYLKLAVPTRSGMRARYELTSPLFAPKVKKSASEPRARRSRMSPTVRMARAFAANQAEREREIA
jgi:hypothetical protein